MERVTISLNDELVRAFDALIKAKGYQNRSEAVRDILRAELDRQRIASSDAGACVGVVSYLYNHHERDLAERVTGHGHEHHDLVVSTVHAHLDHDHCIEATIVRGPVRRVRSFADALIAERGVRHGSVSLVPVDLESGSHHHRHVHAHPKT